MNQNPTRPEPAADDGAVRPVALRIAHATTGRVRFRLAETLARDAVTALINRIAAFPDVARVVARPNTGSIIVETGGANEPLLDSLTGSGVIRIVPHTPSLPVSQLARFGMMRMDAEIGKRTDGMFDVRTALAGILILMAILQLSRGRVAGPAATLLMSAFSLLDAGGKR